MSSSPDLEVETLRQLDRLLDELLDLEPADQQRYLRERCPAELEPRLRGMLALEAGSSPLDQGVPSGVLTSVLEETSTKVLERGTRIGPWEVVEILGQGGMGEVYLARRADGAFEREVALKVATVLHRDDERRYRLEQERRILAGLEHPSIAGLVDGGITSSGRSWFAMELVRGEPIVLACDQRRLSVAQRLELFLEVVRAVELAHRRLVVHRDLKPNNVLVTVAGDVKLLDFGIAGILGEEGEAAETTAWWSPDYASPEIAAGEPVGPASDLFQLGVLLFELVVGVVPREIATRPREAWREAVLSEPMPAAAVRWSQLVAASAGEPLAAQRQTTQRQLARILRGDLGAILARATDLRPEARYPTVAALAEDLERFRDGRPVRARPASATYRMGKWLLRHRVGVAAAALVTVLLTGLVVASAVRLARERSAAQAQARRAETVAAFLADLFRAGDPLRRGGPEPRVRDLLDRGAARVARELEEAPEVRETMSLVLGRAYLGLGDVEAARPLLESVLASRTGRLGDNSSELAPVWLALAEAARIEGKGEAAELAVTDAIRVARSAPDRLAAAIEQARVLRDLGRHQEALEAIADARREAAAPQPEPEAAMRYQLEVVEGSIHFDLSHHLEASPALERAVSAAREVPELEAQRATALSLLAGSELYLGRPVRAREALAEALELQRRVLGELHPETLMASANLAMVLAELGLVDEAIAMALATSSSAGEVGEPLIAARAAVALGIATMLQGDLEGGRSELEGGAALLEQRYGPNAAARAWIELGDALWRSGRRGEAVEWWNRAWEATAWSIGGSRVLEAGWRQALGWLELGDEVRATELLARLSTRTDLHMPEDAAAPVFLDLVRARLDLTRGEHEEVVAMLGTMPERLERARAVDPLAADDLQREVDDLTRQVGEGQ